MADSYNCILQILEYQGEATAEAGTDGNTIIITGHGLGGGDFIVNTTRRATSQSSAERGSRKVTFTDVNTLEVVGADITGMTEGDTIRLYSFIDRTEYLRAGSLSITKRAGGENEASFQIKSAYSSATIALVYAMFGRFSSGNLDDCDEYNTSSDTWFSKTSEGTQIRRYCSTSTILSNLFTFGGTKLTATALKNCDEYSPNNDTWASKTDMPAERFILASSTINDKGYTYCGSYNSNRATYEYNSIANSWATKADSISVGYDAVAGCTILDKGYMMGGQRLSYYKLCHEYDAATNSWTAKTEMPDPARSYASACTLLDKGYIASGTQSSGAQIKDCDEYNPSSDTWASKTDMPEPARNKSVFSPSNNIGYLYGGATTYLSDNDGYNPSTDSWVSYTDMIAPARYGHSGDSA